VQQVKDNGYRATAFAPVSVVAEAATRDEAVDRIRAMLYEKLSGAELVQVNVPVAESPNPWLAVAGTWRDHPDVDEVMENVEECRREVDADPDRP
jgi:hypothetical protein